MSTPAFRHSVPWGLVVCTLAAAGYVCIEGTLEASGAQQAGVQPKVRLNKIIDAIENGRAAMRGEDWVWFDFEHAPFVMSDVAQRLAAVIKDKDASGRPKTTPLVRIPGEGDEDFRWMVKQVLDQGTFGVIFPHMETKEQALNAVRAMRYPPLRTSKYPEPRGLRGHGPGRPATLWALPVQEYIERADVWPLNPQGELIAMMMLESVEGIKNAKEIMQVPGVSAVLVVPGDLGMSLGLPENTTGTNYPEVDMAWQSVLKTCIALKKVCAVIDTVERNSKKRVAEGYKIVG